LKVFGTCDWAVLFILAQGGKTYARLRFNVGPVGSLVIPVAQDYTAEFPASDHAAWKDEYNRHIHPVMFDSHQPPARPDDVPLIEYPV
jgi:hypothetical protein